MAGLKLILGNKNYSSWSLRPWIAMKHAGIAFDEQVARLDFDGDGPQNAHLKSYSPAGRVPVLFHGDLRIWESLAILEYVAELFPEKTLWPNDMQVRARARTAAHEMHAGFAALRSELPMNVRRTPASVGYSASAQADINRIQEIWSGCKADHDADGPFLFGGFSIADTMFAPVVSRFAVYEIAQPDACAHYMETMLDLPAYLDWKTAAKAEPWVIDAEEI